MNNQTIICCVFALVLGMLLANMLKGVCGCKLTEGQSAAVLCVNSCDAQHTKMVSGIKTTKTPGSARDADIKAIHEQADRSRGKCYEGCQALARGSK